MYRLKGETSLQVITTGVVCRDFIGRRHELDFLIEQALQARPGRGSTLIVQGDAGIGKTRLIAEFADIARTHGIVPAIGNCYEFGDPPYAPLLEIAEILGADDAAAALQAQAVDGDARSGRERTRRFAAFAAGLAAIAKTKTVVAVIENLHWADIATLELFRSLSGALKAHPCVLVATLRPEDIGTSGRATTALRAEIERAADATITLQALGPAEMRALLASALRDDGRHVSSTVLEKIAELSDGRPFHAEELLRGMLDYRGTAADAAAAIIPRSLGAAVHDRLASLDESAREILAFAAVIGRRFGAQFLAELAAKPLAEVLLTLRRARNLQLIVEDPDGDAFFFRHQLTREVVYAEILFAEARTLHRRIVEELAAQAEPDAATVAYHAWRSGDRPATVRWNEAAGDAAAGISAHTDATRHYERAFNAADAEHVRTRLSQKVARALYAEGDLEGAARWFATTVASATAAGDLPTAHGAALDRALALWEHGESEAGIAASKAVSAALGGDDSPLRFQAETLTASLLTAAYRADEALAHLDAASALKCAPEPAWALRHRGIRAHTFARLGRLADSQTDFAFAVAGARELGDREQLVRALNNWADVRLRIGDLAGASELYASALDVARDLRSSRLVAWLIANNAYVALFTGRLAAARSLLLEFLTIDHDIEVIWIQGHAILYRLGTLLADESLLRLASIDDALARADALTDRNALALAAGAALAQQIVAGDDPTAFAERVVKRIGGTADVHWFADGVARSVPSVVPAARALLVDLAADAHAEAAAAHLALFDARVALRERRKSDADRLSHEAAVIFKKLGWAIEEAYAREVRGNVKDAVETFRRCGAVAEVGRLTATDQKQPRRRGETTLTTREREIAGLIGTGKSNREVATALVISERTVETHVASIYQKFGIGNRRQLAALLGDPVTRQ
jgi:DNA-binding CsgD family transcriptional regulator/tetratricopeptide (TPR) repeat protein